MTDREDAPPESSGAAIESDGGTDGVPEEQDIGDVLDDLEVLEGTVDSPEERERVREAMRTAQRAGTPRVFGPFDVVTGRFMSVTGTGDV